MANHAGLKKVIKTVRTKKGAKRQTFWVKSAPKEPAKKPAASAPKSGGKITGKHVAGAAAAFGALAAGAYALHKMHKAKKAGAKSAEPFHLRSSGMSLEDIAKFKKKGNSSHGLSGASFGGQRWGSGKRH